MTNELHGGSGFTIVFCGLGQQCMVNCDIKALPTWKLDVRKEEERLHSFSSFIIETILVLNCFLNLLLMPTTFDFRKV